ncbi:MAG: 1,4-alpha-glucan branching protein GlgB [Erysipelotrichaceae bacterium]|nr:1,4-alpha-glucan branching protein GlgB [Erysipelotrichaceae bacterium]
MEFDLNTYYSGYSLNGYEYYGAHLTEGGVVFRLYAPNARSVRVVGDFNGWNNSANFMNKIDHSTWELFIQGVGEWALYKYVIENPDGRLVEKADPYSFYNESRPAWGSKVVNLHYDWHDQDWMKERTVNYDRPVNIYEVHLGGFMLKPDGKWNTYYEMINLLIPYVKNMGYTHIELMPLNEHSLDESWGYQQYGYFSVTSRYGNNYELMMFIDACHQNGIGVIMDVVPVHFVKDSYGLVDFDGTRLYSSEDDRKANSSWGTLYFDYSKPHVNSFMMSSMCMWLDKYHIDGLRLDAISNLIYYEGNKNIGEIPEGIGFMKRFNYHMHQEYPGVMSIAEDSSDFPGVTSVPGRESLGFDYKWDLGWMNDTLKYYHMDPEYRHYHHNLINFSMFYYYSERFILPFSHDEVVHGKLTLIDKMFGSYEDKFAQCRNLMVYLYTHPGKKLSFMGNEFGSFREFDEKKELDWFMLKYPAHDAFRRLVRDLNIVYKDTPAFWRGDYHPETYRWIDADNSIQRVFSYIRYDGKDCYVVLLNMSPVSYEDFRIGVPTYGFFTEIINSERDIYDGCNMCNFHKVRATKQPKHGFKYSMSVRLAPYAGIIMHATVK